MLALTVVPFAFNKTNDNGAAINADHADVTVSNSSTFIGNTASSHGGAIDISGKLTVDGSNGKVNVFYNNSANTGGAIFVHNDTTVTSKSNTYEGNNATGNTGGAIHNGGTLTSSGDSFISNQAATSGGAISNTQATYTDATGVAQIIGPGTVTVSDGRFTSNSATQSGGAIFNSGTTTVTGSTSFKQNTASQGGAIFNDTSGTLKITNTSGNLNSKSNVVFSNNTTSSAGGAILNNENATIQSAGATYTNNSTTVAGGAIYNLGSYTSQNGDTFTGNSAQAGGAIYNKGTFTLNNAALSSFSGNTTTEKNLGSAIYNAAGGTFNINNANDTIDLDYIDWNTYNENTTIPSVSSHRHLFGDGETVYNAGVLNINNSALQLHQHSDLTKGVINVNASKVGTINLDDSRIDIGKSTLYTDTINFKNNSELLTHVNAKSDTDFGKVATNNVSFDSSNNKLTIFVNAGEHLEKGQSKTIEIINTDGSTHTGDFKVITDNKMYEIEAVGDGKYKLTRPADPEPDDPYNPTVCPNGDCIHKAWVEYAQIKGHPKAEQIQDTLNRKAQELGCDSEEYKNALDGVAPDISPLIQAHSTEITRRLAGVISNQLYSSMEKTGYVHNGKRFYKFPRRQSHLWVQGMYGQSEFDAKKGFDMDTQGLAVGLDGHISPDTRLGVAYAYTTADGTAVQRDTEVTSHTISVYGEYNPDRFYTNWLGLYTRSAYEENKKVFQHRIKAEYDVDVFSAQMMFGRKMGPYVIGNWASGVISPEAGLRYTYIKQHGYTDDAGQKVGAADGQILTGILGAQYTIGYTLAPGLAWYPELRAAVTYDFIQPDMENSVTLVNGAKYDVVTENLDKFGIEIGARVGLDINRKTEVAIEYEGLFKGDYTNHTGLASLKYKF